MVVDMTHQGKQKSGHESPQQKGKVEGHQKHNPVETEPAESETVKISRAEYEELLRKAEEFTQIQDRLLRSAADFDNAKKRLGKEREEFVKFALEAAVYDLLPVLDHFEFALAHLEAKDEKTKSIREGFQLIQKQLLQVLLERGLKRVDALGKHFDPHLHEAMGHIVSPNEPEGVVLEEVLTGYQLNGKLLRPAKVKISTKEEKAPGEKTEELT